MAKITGFDWKRFGCNEKAVQDLAKAMGHTIVDEPEGVRVIPGMRVVNERGESRTIAPKGTNEYDTKSYTMSAWTANGRSIYCCDTHTWIYGGKPVLGYA